MQRSQYTAYLATVLHTRQFGVLWNIHAVDLSILSALLVPLVLCINRFLGFQGTDRLIASCGLYGLALVCQAIGTCRVVDEYLTPALLKHLSYLRFSSHQVTLLATTVVFPAALMTAIASGTFLLFLGLRLWSILAAIAILAALAYLPASMRQASLRQVERRRTSDRRSKLSSLLLGHKTSAIIFRDSRLVSKASVLAGMILALPLYLLIAYGIDPFVLLYLAYLLVCPTILYEVFALEEGRVTNRFRLTYRIPWEQVVRYKMGSTLLFGTLSLLSGLVELALFDGLSLSLLLLILVVGSYFTASSYCLSWVMVLRLTARKPYSLFFSVLCFCAIAIPFAALIAGVVARARVREIEESDARLFGACDA